MGRSIIQQTFPTQRHLSNFSLKAIISGMDNLNLIFNQIKWFNIVLLVGLVVFSYIIAQGLFLISRKKIADWLPDFLENELVNFILDSIRFLLPFPIILSGLPFLNLSSRLLKSFNHFLLIILIILLTSLLIRLVVLVGEILLKKYDFSQTNNFKARKIHTQVGIVQKIVIFFIILISISIILLSFDKVKQVGVSILASAGVIGLVVGIAAQKTLSAVIAGIQLALTQPIIIDDVVLVEGEWGRVEEITLTYVVVRVWDLRRLIVPVSYFIEQPFQNWTRTSTDILGSVFLYTDYQVPVDELREELVRILEGSPLWDGKTVGLQVTNFKEHCVELRALMSPIDATKNWDLRCHVREQLLKFMQTKYPQSFVRLRLENISQ